MSDHDTVIEAQSRFDDAELRDDRAVLNELLHPEFQSIGPKGFVLDKEQWIGRHEFFRYHELDVDEIDARVFRDAAIVRSVQRNHADSSGHDVRIATRVSQTWVRDDGAWRLAGIQFSPFADG
ncbi:nuclear transport factor 2 family protein [Tsukamurella sp. 1534]|uniref:nuclear transport factor 2 family protein n=1 Tax=Tsukamurella sp. 1534 TaxID=1151061 RepID=UPI0002F1B02A|nr:nuclear transport factor 2 family protein [Tsukamurella sp. 1534]